jgi:hypothetical protein
MTIHTTARVDKNGNVTVPIGTNDAGREVLVTIQPAAAKMSRDEWLKFIDATAGSIDDPTFERPPQGVLKPAPSFE